MILGAVLMVAFALLTLLLNGMYLLFFAAGATGGLWLFVRGIRTLRHVRDVPVSRIRSAAQGYVALAGSCVPLKPGTVLKAPLSGKSCVWYRFTVSRRSRIDSDAPWTVIRQGTSQVPFLLDDGTGQCLVVPSGATTKATQTQTWYGDSEHPAAGAVVPSHRAQYRFVESRIEPGIRIYLNGEFNSRPVDTGNAATDILNGWKIRSAEMLARFDSNDDGQLDIEEMRVAMQAAREQARSEMDRILAGNRFHLFGKPADTTRPFIIATRPQSGQTRLLRLQAWLGATAFLACGIGLILLWTRGL